LRIAPAGMGVGIVELSEAEFALQLGLRNGQPLADAAAAARALDPAFDVVPVLAGLVKAGAIIDVVLQPADASLPARRDSERTRP
jgi:hypothetical protein